MRKMLSAVLSAALLLAALSGCGGNPGSASGGQSG